jgi:hypothetical protein
MCKTGKTDPEEMRVINGSEKTGGEQLGEDVRDSHEGTYYPVADPTKR